MPLRSAPWRAALPLILAHGALLALFELDRWPVVTLALLALAFAGYFYAGSRLDGQDLKAGQLLFVAALLRLLLLPLPATLSDDIERYLWDGRVITAGFNPYALAPDAEAFRGLRDDHWQRLPHREVPSVYPPFALVIFSIAIQLPAPRIGLKAMLVAIDLLTCWLLFRLARARGRPGGRAVWYAWSPLATVEIAAMGHIDALGVAAQVACVVLLFSPQPRWRAAAAGAAGVLAKLMPIVALPMWARQSRRALTFLAVALGLVVAVGLPVSLAAGGVPPGLVIYGVSWEFNGPLYEPLWRLVERTQLSEAVKGGLDSLKIATEHRYDESLNSIYPFVYPQLLAKLVLALVFGFVLWRSLYAVDPITGSGRLFGAVLLCSATLYPWYLLWVLPWAGHCRHRAWLLLTALIQLSYLPQLTTVPLVPWVYLLIWLPFALLWIRSRWSTA